MRLAIMILLVAAGWGDSGARADEALRRIELGDLSGYIVSKEYAEQHQVEIISTIPRVERIEGFWTPSEQDAEVADRVFRELIHSAAKDPTVLFPDLTKDSNPNSPDSLESQRNELILISKNYDKYLRQYVGIIIGGTRLVFCNYSDGPKFDPSTNYILIHKVFVADGSVHFLQCRFEPVEKVCSNVSIIGSWQVLPN